MYAQVVNVLTTFIYDVIIWVVNVSLIKSCSFIGHRTIEVTDNLINKVRQIIEKLIVEDSVEIFLFGSKSQFNDLCYSIVTELKEKYPNIKRVDVRTNYEFLNGVYLELTLKHFEDSIYPKECSGAARVSYIKRNQAMIDASDYCVFYYDENYLPEKRKQSKDDISLSQPKSGTAIAFKYAKQKKKKVFNVFGVA